MGTRHPCVNQEINHPHKNINHLIRLDHRKRATAAKTANSSSLKCARANLRHARAMPALPFSLSIDVGKLVNESIRTRGPVNSNG